MPATQSLNRALRATPDVRIDFDVETPMRDGTILRSDIYRPAGPDPAPVILRRTPYDKRLNHQTHMGLDVRAATARGYAVAVQDVRGRFASEGTFLITPTQKVEGPDGYDTIEWLAAQPWCSGAIGMVGSSYDSLTQLMAAIERPPHLRAIIPEKTGTPARGAVLLDSIMIAWTAGQALDWFQKAMLRQEAGEKEASIIRGVLKDPQAAAKHLPLDDMPLRKIGSLPTFQQMIELFHSQADLDIDAINVPALIVSGWYDMATTETVQIYEKLLKRKDGETNILFGPWDHGNALPALGEVYFSPFAGQRLAEIANLYLDFYDRHLKGDTSKPAPGAKYFTMGANEWHTVPTWPPASESLQLHLHSQKGANSTAGDGVLSIAPAVDNAPADTYRYDPLDPVPSIDGRYFEAGGSRPGPFDQRRVEQRRDVLVYTGEPLAADMEIAGRVILNIFMACSTPDTDLVVKLCDVQPNDISYNILDEYYRCRWREGYSKTLLFEPNKVYNFTIDVGPVAHSFRAGHRIRLQITSSAFPHFDRNMNTGNPIGTDTRGLVAEVTVFHDAKHPTALVIPVIKT